jgi:hypothetical protein
VKRIFLLLFLLPVLSNCTQYSAMLSPALTLAHTGNIAQATSSLAINKAKDDYVESLNLNAELICPTHHSSELNEIFFETIDHMDCYYDPLSILR